MQITLTGHHLDITDGIREAVKQRLSKLGSRYPKLSGLDVIVKLDSGAQCVEINSHGISASAAASDRDLYVAIAQVARKLDAALSHKRGTASAKRNRKPELLVETSVEDAA